MQIDDSNSGFAPDDPRLNDFRWRRVRVSTARLSAMVQDMIPRATVVGISLVCPGGDWVLVVHSPDFSPAPNDGERLNAPPPLWEDA